MTPSKIGFNKMTRQTKLLPEHIHCPRCGSDSTAREVQEIPLGSGMAKIDKQTCSNCQTKFYFEENIIGFLYSTANQNPQIETTQIESNDEQPIRRS